MQAPSNLSHNRSIYGLPKNLLQADEKGLARLRSLPHSDKLFKQGKSLSDRLDTLIKKLNILTLLNTTKEEIEKGEHPQSQSAFKQALSLQGKNKKIETMVYGKMWEMTGKLDILDIGRKSFDSPSTQASLKIAAIDVAIDYYQNHWAQKLMKELREVEQEILPAKEEWQILHLKLITFINKRGVNPVAEDNPNVFRQIVNDFVALFDKVPESEKKRVVHMPLYPASFRPEMTLPLNYIVFTSNMNALEKIEPYLDSSDWLAKGPYGSTFVHCLLDGMLKCCSLEPEEFLKIILKKFPLLKSQCNELGKTPKTFLSDVVKKLEYNLTHFPSEGGYGRESVMIDVKGDSYSESRMIYDLLLGQSRSINKLLTE